MKGIINIIDIASLFDGERGQLDALQPAFRPSCPKISTLSMSYP
jgi:hypothetical protein